MDGSEPEVIDLTKYCSSKVSNLQCPEQQRTTEIKTSIKKSVTWQQVEHKSFFEVGHTNHILICKIYAFIFLA